MMKRLLAAALFVFPGIAQAEYFDTGNEIWNVCTDNAPGHNYLCIGMAAAYYDMMVAAGYQCAMPAGDRTQVRDVILKYLSDNPATRTTPASELAIAAFATAFQCAKPAPLPATTARSAKQKPKAGPVMLTPVH
jgi:hypothetical protein